MRTYRLDCGCKAMRDREVIVEPCAKCRAEFDEVHQRAAADYRASHPDSEFKSSTEVAVSS